MGAFLEDIHTKQKHVQSLQNNDPGNCKLHTAIGAYAMNIYILEVFKKYYVKCRDIHVRIMLGKSMRRSAKLIKSLI